MTPNSRSYLKRWIQPDSIIPANQGVQGWDRYAYAYNNPINYTDPSGHIPTPQNNPLIEGLWGSPAAYRKDPKINGGLRTKLGWLEYNINRSIPWGSAQSSDDNWVDLGFDWLLEHGNEERYFGENTYMKQDLMNHPGVVAARDEYYEQCNNGTAPPLGEIAYYYHDFGPDGYKEAWRNLDGTGHFLGSYRVSITALDSGMLSFRVENNTNWASATNFRSSRLDVSLVENVIESANYRCNRITPFKTLLPDWARGETFFGIVDLGGNHKQIYEWTEPIP